MIWKSLPGTHRTSISAQGIGWHPCGIFSRSSPFVTKYHSLVLVGTDGGNAPLADSGFSLIIFSRSHLFRPRSVIPDQQIHSSVLSGDVYMPRATLGSGIAIPTARTSDGLWATETQDEEAATRLLSSLLNDQQSTLACLEKVLFLLDSSALHPLLTYQPHKSDAYKLSSANQWTNSISIKTSVVGGRHSQATRFRSVSPRRHL